MNSDLTQTGAVEGTDNPQGAASPAGASNASDFQQAAGMEVLNQTRSLTVADNGQPNTVNSNPAAAGTSAGAYAAVIIGTVIFLVVCARLIQWVKAAPPKQPAAEQESASTQNSLSKQATTKKTAQKGKKKQPRSKRRKR